MGQIVYSGDVLRAQRQRSSGELIERIHPPDQAILQVEVSLHRLQHDLPVRNHTQKIEGRRPQLYKLPALAGSAQ